VRTLLYRLRHVLAARPAARRPARRRLELEALEGRLVPSVAAAEIHVNTTATLGQFDAANARSANGMRIAVWTHQYSTTETDIRAQVYNANGTRRGGELKVARSTASELEPDVSMDNAGNAVVVWRKNLSSTNWDVQAARIINTSAGPVVSSIITVINSSKKGHDPSVACAANGEFVVSYTRDWTTTDTDVHAKRYSAAGVQLGGPILVANTLAAEANASVARSTGSAFTTTGAHLSIAYTVGGNVVLKRYSNTGALINTHTIGAGTAPDVAMDNADNTVVACGSRWFVAGSFGLTTGVRVRRVENNGVMGAALIAQSLGTSTLPPRYRFGITMDRSDGDFAVVVARSNWVLPPIFGTETAAVTVRSSPGPGSSRGRSASAPRPWATRTSASTASTGTS
jgi:hypothetical protein